MKEYKVRNLMIVALAMLVVLGLANQFVVIAAPTTVKVAAWWFTEVGRKEWLHEQLDKFEDEHPGIKIERIPIATGDVHDKFMTEAAAGTGPDVLWFRDTSLKPFVSLGFLEPLDDYIDFASYDLEAENDFAILNGKRYAINLMGIQYGQLIYNKKMFEEAGLEPPTTPEELLVAAKILTNAPHQYGFGMPVDPGEPEFFAQNIQKFAAGFDAGIAKGDGTISVNDPGFIEGMRWLKKFYDANVTPKGVNWMVQRRMLAEDKVAMVFDGAYQFGVIDGFRSGHSENFGAIRPPFPSDYVMTTQIFMGINSASKHKEEASVFLKWWMGEDIQQAFNMYGLHVGTRKVDFPTEWMDKNPFYTAYDDPSLKPMPTVVMGHEEKSEQIRRTLVNHVSDILFSDKPIEDALNEAQRSILEIVQ